MKSRQCDQEGEEERRTEDGLFSRRRAVVEAHGAQVAREGAQGLVGMRQGVRRRGGARAGCFWTVGRTVAIRVRVGHRAAARVVAAIMRRSARAVAMGHLAPAGLNLASSKCNGPLDQMVA